MSTNDHKTGLTPIPLCKMVHNCRHSKQNICYDSLLKWHTKGITAISHQDRLDEAKDKVEKATGLRPTNIKLLIGVRALGVPPRLEDHIRCTLTGRIKCGPYWTNILEYMEKAFCSFCKTRRTRSR